MAKANTQTAKPGGEIDAVNIGLRGPVIDAIKRCVPELRTIDREVLYERVMNTPELAALCFKVFRANPVQFESVLIGPNGQGIVNDNQPLNCGRTLAEVITLVVRAVARRHFRATLDGKTERQFAAPRSNQTTLVHRAAQLLGIEPKPGTRPVAKSGAKPGAKAGAQPKKKEISLGDRVYRALYEYLVFEWQVQLIPEYANIPIEVIPEVGPYLYGARDVESVRALAGAKLPDLAAQTEEPLSPEEEAAAVAALAGGDDDGPPDERNYLT